MVKEWPRTRGQMFIFVETGTAYRAITGAFLLAIYFSTKYISWLRLHVCHYNMHMWAPLCDYILLITCETAYINGVRYIYDVSPVRSNRCTPYRENKLYRTLPEFPRHNILSNDGKSDKIYVPVTCGGKTLTRKSQQLASKLDISHGPLFNFFSRN